MALSLTMRRVATSLRLPAAGVRFKSAATNTTTSQVPAASEEQRLPFTGQQEPTPRSPSIEIRYPVPDFGTPKTQQQPMADIKRKGLEPMHFVTMLRDHGTDFFAGVPDSLLKDVCSYISEKVPQQNHKITANEGTALALAAGHHLATKQIPCVYLQNSGLGNIVNPLLSLCSDKVYSIPVLVVIGWRGEPGKKDEPQHMLQGSVTPGLLQQMGVPYETLPDDTEGAFNVLQKAYSYMEEKQAPFALLVKKNTFASCALTSDQGAFNAPDMLRREEILELIAAEFPEAPLVTTTGFTSREVFEMRQARGDGHDKDFLTVGSMGHCSSIALGVALAQPQREVLCVDGDGAALMHLGAMATAGLAGASNFKHVLINNAVHDSVGGQATGGGNVDFPAIARACGYRGAAVASTADEIDAALRELKRQEGPYFLELRALPGARKDLGRPTTSTRENKEAFMSMLARKQVN